MLMAGGTVISRVLGFARAVILALAIGVTTDAADAFGVANQLPNNVYAIIVGGLLNAVLVPQIVKARSNQDGGKGYIDRLLTLIITVFFVVTLAATIAAPLLVSLYTKGWSADQLALATAFAYWCLPQLFFYGLYAILGEVLNARSAFGPYTWAPVLNNLVSLLGLAAFVLIFGADPTGSRAVSNWDASQIALLAGTATAGVAAQALILLFAWRHIGLKLNFNFKWRGFGLRPALKAATWSFGMVLITQLGGLVQTIVASGAVEARATNPAVAGVAAAAIAWLIFMLPHSVATVSIATAYFTKMSTHVQDGKMHLLKADLAAGLRSIAVISVFATVALIVMAYPVSRIFVGEFLATIALGNVLIALMFGLVPFSFVFMMQRAFYALEDTRTPFLFTSIQILIHVAGSLTMAVIVPADSIVMALGALTSFTLVIQSVIAFKLLTRQIGPLGEHKIAVAGVQFISAAAVSMVAGFSTIQVLGGISAGSFVLDSVMSSLVSMIIIGTIMLGVYVMVLRLLKVREIDTVFAGIKGILRR
jgi:putative peptidoglycan lipid II flippase